MRRTSGTNVKTLSIHPIRNKGQGTIMPGCDQITAAEGTQPVSPSHTDSTPIWVDYSRESLVTFTLRTRLKLGRYKPEVHNVRLDILYMYVRINLTSRSKVQPWNIILRPHPLVVIWRESMGWYNIKWYVFNGSSGWFNSHQILCFYAVRNEDASTARLTEQPDVQCSRSRQ